ncbi:MAG TPA: hypothetical protein VJU83_11130 [Burkholderiales bacterium]|nr:hypothetical protein [Burkholderiales bacterium]
MRLHQLKVEYQSSEDRLLLRLASEDGAEVLFSVTRRVTRFLWQVLLEMAQSAPEIRLQANPDARHAMLGMRHEAALSQANFSERYDDMTRERPLGAEPLLVSRLERKRDEAGQHVLGLFPVSGQGVFLTMDEALLHGMVKLLENGAAKADWALDLRISPYVLPLHTDSQGLPTLN